MPVEFNIQVSHIFHELDIYFINRFNSATFLCLSKARICISNTICRDIFCIQLIQVFVHLIDFGGIVDHHCLNFLIIVKIHMLQLQIQTVASHSKY